MVTDAERRSRVSSGSNTVGNLPSTAIKMSLITQELADSVEWSARYADYNEAVFGERCM